MKRRGFLGALLGLPAAPLFAKALEAPKPVPVAPVVESEPLPEHVKEVMAQPYRCVNNLTCSTMAGDIYMDGLLSAARRQMPYFK